MVLRNSLSQMGDGAFGAWGRWASLPVSPVSPALGSFPLLLKLLSSTGPSLALGLGDKGRVYVRRRALAGDRLDGQTLSMLPSV